MKVVLVDNFDREEVSDILLKANLTEEEAVAEADSYNAKHGDNHLWFAMAKDDDYKLWDSSELY